MFIWIDLRRYLRGTDEVAALANHRLTPQEAEKYQQREQEMGNRFFANGVFIAMGTNFATEELGWFRLSFTVPRQALEVGLQRMLKALKETERVNEEPRAKL
jgi:bifunctional pyridoxal-dependent enzyme with beta-cystathionase and maltose regulon repressor activities